MSNENTITRLKAQIALLEESNRQLTVNLQKAHSKIAKLQSEIEDLLDADRHL